MRKRFPVIILFFLCFLPFMTDFLENEYLFYANSVTTYFYYIIPALLNGSAVLFMLSVDGHSFLRDSNAIKAWLFTLLVYKFKYVPKHNHSFLCRGASFACVCIRIQKNYFKKSFPRISIKRLLYVYGLSA